MEDEDYLWAGIPFIGGFAGHQDAPCGAISASTVFLGLKNKYPSTEKEKAKSGREKARTETGEFVRDFKKQFDDISCIKLVGYDFTDKAAAEKAKEAGEGMANCPKYIEFALEKIYEFENRG